MAEIAIEPTHKSMNDAIYLNRKFESAVEVQLSNCDLLKIYVIEFGCIGEDVLMVNWIHYGLRKHPFLHALHAHSIDIIPKGLS